MIEDSGYTDIVGLLVKEHYTWVLVLVILLHALAILSQTLPAIFDKVSALIDKIREKRGNK